jgi:hypothetical protein
VGGNAAALGLGFEPAAADNTTEDYIGPATAVTCWQNMRTAHPGLREAFVWNASKAASDGAPFINECGAVDRAQPTLTLTPTDNPPDAVTIQPPPILGQEHWPVGTFAMPRRPWPRAAQA